MPAFWRRWHPTLDRQSTASGRFEPVRCALRKALGFAAGLSTVDQLYAERCLNQSRTGVAVRLGPPNHTSEADDLRDILGYLGIAQSSAEARQITGLSKSAISEVLSGRRKRETSRRTHIAVVAEVIRQLRAARLMATGAPARGKSAIGWLHATRIDTSRGSLSPLAILSDTALAQEALDGLAR